MEVASALAVGRPQLAAQLGVSRGAALGDGDLRGAPDGSGDIAEQEVGGPDHRGGGEEEQTLVFFGEIIS